MDKLTTAERELPDFNDPRVQIVYAILVDDELPPNREEHWEGWLSRKIVAALQARAGERVPRERFEELRKMVAKWRDSTVDDIVADNALCAAFDKWCDAAPIAQPPGSAGPMVDCAYPAGSCCGTCGKPGPIAQPAEPVADHRFHNCPECKAAPVHASWCSTIRGGSVDRHD